METEPPDITTVSFRNYKTPELDFSFIWFQLTFFFCPPGQSVVWRDQRGGQIEQFTSWRSIFNLHHCQMPQRKQSWKHRWLQPCHLSSEQSKYLIFQVSCQSIFGFYQVVGTVESSINIKIMVLLQSRIQDDFIRSTLCCCNLFLHHYSIYFCDFYLFSFSFLLSFFSLFLFY